MVIGGTQITESSGKGGSVGVGTTGQIAIYAAGSAVLGDPRLTDNSTALTYTGAGGIIAPIFSAGGTAGVTAGSFASITAIQTVGGIVTILTGTSDESLKTNIKPFERGLDAVLAIRPVTFTWNEAGQKKTGFAADQTFAGFTAQDLQKAIPEAVGPEGEHLGISNRPIIAALVNAIKDQHARALAAEARALGAESTLTSFALALEHRSVDFDTPLHFIRRNWVTLVSLVIGNAAIAELLIHFAK
jgi:Chaperone of endosialidase